MMAAEVARRTKGATIMPDNHALKALVHRNISAEDVRDCRAYYDTEIKDAGVPVRVGLRAVPMPFRGIRVFVDLMPNANWGHRVAYLLASQDLMQSVRYDEQFPPFGGDVPDHWRAITLA
jgi:hypothetical protein